MIYNIRIIILVTSVLFLINCASVEDAIKIIINETATSDSTDTQSGKATKNVPKNTENVNDIDNWDYNNRAKHDNKESFDETEGSIKLEKSGKDWESVDFIVFNNKLPVEPGKNYEFTFKSKTNTWPSPVIRISGSLNDTRGMRVSRPLETTYSNSEKGVWEENKYLIKVPDNKSISSFTPRVYMLPKIKDDGDIWLDDFRMRELPRFVDKINIKKNQFNGSKTRVDELGNVEIYIYSEWEAFFPFCMYTDNHRKDWSVYSKQGFNCNMWASSASAIKRAKKAGMYSGIQLNQYIMNVDWMPKDANKKDQHLRNTLSEIKSQGLMKQVLFYYIDNEFYNITDRLTSTVNIVKELDTDNRGKRMHPIYMLNGAAGVARKYNNITDITGTYVAEDRTVNETVDNFTILHNAENQSQPAVIAQINRGVGMNFKPVLFGAIARGAKGMGFWRDGASGINIEKAKWWNNFPKIVKEIKQMMPLIRQPHFTNWSAECGNNTLIIGTRMLQNKGYLIIANPTESKVVEKITVTGIPYKISSTEDYFTDKTIGKVDNNVVSITLEPHGTKVIRLN